MTGELATAIKIIAYVAFGVFVAIGAVFIVFVVVTWLWADWYATAHCMTLLGEWVCQ